MGKMYEDWNKLICDQLCEEMKKFEHCKTKEQLCIIKDLVEVKNGLAEMEMDGAIRQIAEDRYGYDSDAGRFRDTDSMYEFAEMFNAGRGGRGRGRRRDSRGRYIANMAGPMPKTFYPMDPDMYPWEYPPYMMNDGRREYSGERGMREDDDDDMMNAGRGGRGGRMGGSSGRGGRSGGNGSYNAYPNGGDDDMYMLRQENGRPIMTPYNAHDPHDIPKKLTDQQYDEWMQNLENEDGTDGAKWTKQQIEAEAKKAGVDYNKVGLPALWACTNMMYSDYCGVAQKYGVDRPGFYIHLAEAFLNDEDFDGDGKEKLSIYYHTIADKQ